MNDSSPEAAEALDPRVQIELERLNSATDEINRLEVELDEARLGFRRLLAEGHIRIQQLTKKLGTSVHKARPYYEARFRASITAQELQTANVAYDKANSAHSAAREMVFLAEQGLSRLAEGSDGGVTLDPAWQEMLNHATARVNQAESERAAMTIAQRTRAASHRAAATLVHQLQSNLKRHITKSRPYFEEKARINSALEAQKAKIQTLEQQVTETKQRYSQALRNLERISDEIHKHRSRRQSMKNDPNQKILETNKLNDLNLSDAKLKELCMDRNAEENVREWLRKVDVQRGNDDNWTEIDLDFSSPEDVSFEKCSLRPQSDQSSPPSPITPITPVTPYPLSRATAAAPRRIITTDRTASLKAELEKGRRQSLDALLHDTGEKVKEMFQGFRPSPALSSLFDRSSLPRSPTPSDDTHSDTDSLTSVEMLTDDQIASLMLDAQLEAVCDRLAGIEVKPRSPQSPQRETSI